VTFEEFVTPDPENNNETSGFFVWRPSLFAETVDFLGVTVVDAGRNVQTERNGLTDGP
jgi:hypothetical protein